MCYNENENRDQKRSEFETPTNASSRLAASVIHCQHQHQQWTRTPGQPARRLQGWAGVGREGMGEGREAKERWGARSPGEARPPPAIIPPNSPPPPSRSPRQGSLPPLATFLRRLFARSTQNRAHVARFSGFLSSIPPPARAAQSRPLTHSTPPWPTSVASPLRKNNPHRHSLAKTESAWLGFRDFLFPRPSPARAAW